MSSLPPYPADFEAQKKWYESFEEILNKYIHAIYLECWGFKMCPSKESLNLAFIAIEKILKEADDWMKMVIDIVGKSERSDPTITTEPILGHLRQIAADFYSRKKSMYEEIKSVTSAVSSF